MRKNRRSELNRVKNRIKRELGIEFTGSTEQELLQFVNTYVRALPSDYVEPSSRRPYKPLAPAPTKKGGLFRKHGQDGKFQPQNT